MFREVVRQKQVLSKEESIEVLKNSKRGVLSVLGDHDYPYGMPLNHYYEDGVLYFHSGMIGHKIDAMKNHSKASFCVFEEVGKEDWALNFHSVIVFGKIRFIDDYEEAMELTRKLSHKFTLDDSYIDEEIKKSGKATLCFALEIEHITGKKVNEK